MTKIRWKTRRWLGNREDGKPTTGQPRWQDTRTKDQSYCSEGEAFVVQLHQLKQIATRRFSIHADRSGKPLLFTVLRSLVLQVSTVPLSSKFQSHFLRSSKSIQYSQSHFLRSSQLPGTIHTFFLLEGSKLSQYHRD